MNLFRKTTPDDAAVDQARQGEAHTTGLRDGREGAAEHEHAWREAYDRGRRDERARHHPRRRHPVLGAVLVLAAATGAFVIYLGVRQGSFAGGGQVVDQGIANATASAQQASRDAAGRAGDALEHAGRRLKHTSGAG
ncbi:MAG TPA: hypothetical protein VMT68_03600 [Caulobacteraceae bacterium]|nr:hypothetical protein [Caulobacteraceae bacterium]